jgi:hypothetical protein
MGLAGRDKVATHFGPAEHLAGLRAAYAAAGSPVAVG